MTMETKFVDTKNLWLGTGTLKDMDDPRAASVFTFDCGDVAYRANDLNEVAQLWAANGCKKLIAINRCG